MFVQLTVALLLASVKGQRIVGRIVEGELARANQFPYAAAIYSTTPAGTYFCSGSFISNQWVLTAAQCVSGATQFTIFGGSTLLQGTDSHRVTITASSSFVHSSYNAETLQHDIGLIKLRLPITFNDYISAISLPGREVDEASQVTSIGWGHTTDHDADLSNNLLYAQLVTISNEECRSIYGSGIDDDMLCVAGGLYAGICAGDSGGPLIEYRGSSMPVHVGVASFYSSQGCENAHPSGYIRTYPYVDWIRNATGIAV